MRHLALACWYLSGPGSVERISFRLGRELSRYYRVTYLSQALPGEAPWAKFQAVGTPMLRPLGSLRRPVRKAYFSIRCATELEEIHRRDPIDFVLAESPWIAALGAKPFRTWSGVPFAYHIHGDVFERPAGTYGWSEELFYRWVTPLADRSADLIVTGAPQFVELSVGRGAKPSAVRLLPNAIDLAEIGLDDAPPPQRAPRSGPLRILSTGRLAVEKDLPSLIDACALLRTDFTLDVYGAGPMEEPLRRRIAAAGLAERIHLRGTVPRVEIGAICRDHDLFVLPSRSEVFPVAILDALAAGLPAIVTTVGGNGIMVREGENGLLVPPGDPAALAAAIARVAADEPLRVRLAAAARSSVLPRYSWSAVTDLLVSCIEETLERQPHRRKVIRSG